MFAAKCRRLCGASLLLAGCFLSAGAQGPGPASTGSGALVGTVLDPQSFRVPGARITVFDESARTYDITSDCSGFYRFSHLHAGKYTVRFGSIGFRNESRSIEVIASQTTELNVKLQLGQFVDWGPTIETTSGPLLIGSLTGIVSDVAGAVIPGTRIAAVQADSGQTFKMIADNAGHYTFSSLAPGQYGVRFEFPGFKTETQGPILIRQGDVTQLDIHLSVAQGWGVEVTPEPGVALGEAIPVSSGPLGPLAAIQGTVMDARGAVPARITAVEESTAGRYETTTDSSGRYTLPGLQAGNYCVRFTAAGQRSESMGNKYETSVSIPVGAPGVTDLNITLPSNFEVVEVCSASCMIESVPLNVSAIHPGISLHVYAPRNVTSPRSELRLTVALTNISKHKISIPAGSIPGSAFDYQISAFGACNCPGELHRNAGVINRGQQSFNDAANPRQIRIRPGETVVDKIDLNQLMDLSLPMVYAIVVKRADPSIKKNAQNTNGTLVYSPPIKVAVMAKD